MTKKIKGLIHIYTGDGKGKTTSAVGALLRATVQKLRCCYISFYKDPYRYGCGEIKILKKLKIKTLNFVKYCPYFDKKIQLEKLNKEIKNAIIFIKTNIFKKGYDLVVLDEILVCVREKVLDINKLIDLIKSKPKKLELILTGQSNKEIVKKLKKYVDYITFMKNLKHPYDSGIKGRRGIEY
ncbi:MAG: cob(I)yrinic acid a,c-diamide adenosyltransferase [Endomicrobiia bacterium]